MEFQNRKPKIGIFGMFQNGKSTLINCILKKKYAAVGGGGMSVTSLNTTYTYGQGKDMAKITYNNGEVKTILLSDFQVPNISHQSTFRSVNLILHNDSLMYFDLLDTPGFNANEHDSDIAKSAVDDCDMGILVVRNKGLSQTEKEIAKMLRNNNVPFVVIMNCFYDNSCYEMWNPSNNQNKIICNNILADLDMIGCSPSQFNKYRLRNIYSVNLIWYWLSIINNDENRTIKLCQKQVRYLWNDLVDEDYSERKLREVSNVNKFIRLFYNYNLSVALIKYPCLKERNNKIRSILDRELTDSDNCINHSIAFTIEKIQTKYRIIIDSKEKELKHINDSILLFYDKCMNANIFMMMKLMREQENHRKRYIQVKKELEMKKQELFSIVKLLNYLKI